MPAGAAPPAVTLPGGTVLGALAARYGGAVDQAASGRAVLRLAPIDDASEGDLAPLSSRRFLRAARASGAALLIDEGLARHVEPGRRWIHPTPVLALARLLADLAPPPPGDARRYAHVSPEASVDASACIGPGAVVMAGASIGPGSRIEPNAVVYGGVRIGARVIAGAGSVIGRPGFGWTAAGPDDGGAARGLVRIPQLGGVIIEDDVELGPLCTVDAGTLAPTRILRGAKLDAHVHVGHNAVVGEGAVVAAQAGFAGSARLGAGVQVGGQAGVADHVHVGDGARVGAKAGVIGDVPPGAVVAGYPAVDRTAWLRAVARSLADPKRRRGKP